MAFWSQEMVLLGERYKGPGGSVLTENGMEFDEIPVHQIMGIIRRFGEDVSDDWRPISAWIYGVTIVNGYE